MIITISVFFYFFFLKLIYWKIIQTKKLFYIIPIICLMVLGYSFRDLINNPTFIKYKFRVCHVCRPNTTNTSVATSY